MKTQLSVTPQPVQLNLRAVSSGAINGQQGEAVKAAETLRPVVRPGAASRGGAPAKSAAAPERPQDTSSRYKTDLRFSVDEPSGRMVVSFVDRDTSEVVRQIPAEELLAIARQIEEQLRESGSTDGLFVESEA